MKKYIYIFIIVATVFTVSCSKNDVGVSPEPSSDGSLTGTGGSTARFTIVNDHLYTVDHYDLNVFDISNENEIKPTSTISLGWTVETIFPFNDLLLIGTMEGVQIFDVSENPAEPNYLDRFSHVTACDPVVAEGNTAYATIRDGSWCGGGSNSLFVLDITNPQNIQLIKEYEMDNPGGLGVKNSVLYICDNGLQVYDASNPLEVEKINSFNIECTDVIPLNDILLVIGKDGFYQYRIVGDDLQLLSSILVK